MAKSLQLKRSVAVEKGTRLDIQEMDAELDVHVVSGFIQGGTFSRPSSIRLA
jgi:hypothetical protein